MFQILFGLTLGQFFDQLFGKKEGSSNINQFASTGTYLGYKANQETLKPIFAAEQASLKVKREPYFDNRWSIAFGSTNVYDDNNRFIREVRRTDTWQGLKNLLGRPNEDDWAFAERLAYNELGRANGYKIMAKALDGSNIPFHKRLADALYDFSYNSGGAFSRINCQGFCDNVRNRLPSVPYDKHLAKCYLKMRLDYVKNNVSLKDWNEFKRGWILRYYWNAKLIEGSSLSLASLRSTYKTPSSATALVFKEYGLMY